MLEGDEDPLFLLRRMIRFASKDVGLADPMALTQGVSALERYRLLGSPEGDLALAHLAVHLTRAPSPTSSTRPSRPPAPMPKNTVPWAFPPTSATPRPSS
jgi:replication-associated recombination protein RarA